MIFLKSILAGFIALVAVAILSLFTVLNVLSLLAPRTPEGKTMTVSFDPMALSQSPPFNWVLPLAGFVVFVLGFSWRYRRLRRS